MYNTLKTRINAGGVKLSEIQEKIKRFYANGDITVGQMEELMELSQQKADPEAERPDIMEILRSVVDRVTAIEEKLKDSDAGSEEDAAVYEAWAPWDGISNKYQNGAIVSHNGKLWKSTYVGQNTWEPGTVGTELLWTEYKEE